MGYIYTKSGKLAKRLYFGAVLLFEGLYYTFKNRVLADGGTFVENELPTISQDDKLVLTPNAYKSGKLYSAVPNDGTGDFTVDRNSTATYIDEDGIIRTALANVPRIDWSSGEAVIFGELQATNLTTHSEDFNNVIWIKTNVTILSDQQFISLDNPLGAFLLKDNATDAEHYVEQRYGSSDNLQYTFSVLVKAYTPDFVFGISVVAVGSSNTTSRAIFNITNEVVTKDVFNGIITETKIQEVSNGWYKCSITYTLDGTVTSHRSRIHTGTPATLYVGNEDGIYINNAQLEQASTSSSYIPTNGTTVTRLADDISVPTPAGVTAITETIDGVDQTPITTIPTTYTLPVGNINKVTML